MTTLAESLVRPQYLRDPNPIVEAALTIVWLGWQLENIDDLVLPILAAIVPSADAESVAQFAEAGPRMLREASQITNGLSHEHLDMPARECLVAAYRVAVVVGALDLADADAKHSIRISA